MPSTSAGIEQNIIATRAGFYGYGSGTGAMRYDQQQTLATNMMFNGSGTSAMDASRAMMLGQSNGIGMGLSNYRQLAMGVSNMSNLMPGAGMEGSMQAFVASQQPRNVNVMRFMGIMARDPQTGKPVSPDVIALQLWNKISKERRTDMGPITKDALATSLLPGGALDSLLNQVTGGDQMLRQQIEAYFYAKASGAKNMSKSELTRVGLRTDYENATAKRNAEGFRGIAQTSRSSAAGAELGTQFSTAVEAFANAVDRFTGYQKLGTFGNGFFDTAGSALNGLGATGGLMALFKFLGLTRAGGGSVGGDSPYIVGEKGPELFLPKTDGVIIPSHLLGTKNRHEGGGVKHSHGWGGDNSSSAGEVEKILRQAGFKGQGLEEAMTIVQHESGNNPFAQNMKGGDNSYGLFQINMIGNLKNERLGKKWKTADGDTFKLGSVEDLYDPLTAARVAYHMSAGGKDWSAWTTKKYLDRYKNGGNGSGAGASDSSSTSGSEGITTLQGSLANQMTAQSAYMKDGKGGSVTNVASGAIVININGAKDPKAVGEAVKTSVQEVLKK